MLAKRRRRWPNMKPILGQCLALTKKLAVVIGPILFYCWVTIADGYSALRQHLFCVSKHDNITQNWIKTWPTAVTMAQHYASIWPASVVMGTCGVCDSRLVDLPVLDTPYQHGQPAGSGVYTIPWGGGGGGGGGDQPWTSPQNKGCGLLYSFYPRESNCFNMAVGRGP